MTVRTSQILLILSAFLTGLVIFLGVFLYASGNLGGGGPGASAIGGPFKLIDQDGKTITDADFRGRPFLVFFGYHALSGRVPDHAVRCRRRSCVRSARMRDRAGALFITVDPERDTPAVHQGLSVELRSASARRDRRRARRSRRSKRPIGSMPRKCRHESGDYSMDHTALVYLMDKQGRFVAPFSLKRRPEEAAADLQRYL